ncbi:hypothetical protein PSTT_07736, partial [Puccinia striiformis]
HPLVTARTTTRTMSSNNNQLEPSAKNHPSRNRVSIHLPVSGSRTGTPTPATAAGSASAHRASLSSTPIPTPHHRNPVFAQHTPSGSINQPSSTTRFGGLSAKQVDKISSAIASVRDHSRPQSRATVNSTHHRHRSDKPKHKSTLKQQTVSKPSSFSHAPLNSRLPALTPRKASHRTSHQQNQRGRQIAEGEGGRGRGGAYSEDENEQDGYEDEEEEEGSMDGDQTGEFLNKLRLGDTQNHQQDPSPIPSSSSTIPESHDHLHHQFTGTGIEYQELVSKAPLLNIMKTSLPMIRSKDFKALDSQSIKIWIHRYERYHLDCGLVNHALCASIRDILKEYMTLVVQLEDQFNRSPDFTLQRFWFYVHDMLHTLKLLYSFTTELVCLYSPDLLSSSSDGGGGGDGEGSEEDAWEQDPGLKAVLKESTRKDESAEKGWYSSGGGGTSCGVAEGAMVKGGEVLAILEERVMRSLGDPIALKLYSDLLLKASQPYCKMLIQWVAKESSMTPTMSSSSRKANFTDEYWERKYVLRNRAATVGGVGADVHPTTSHVGTDGATANDGRWSQAGKASWRREKGVWGGAVLPRFLEVWEVKILLAGKYVNVIRECGVRGRTDEFEVHLEQAPDSEGSAAGLIKMNDDWFYGLIDRAYVSANRSLLELLMSFTTFLDSASYELGKKLRHVNVSRLQNQFDLAIRNPSSSSSSDPYKEDVKVTMATTSLTDWLLRIVGVTGLIGGSFGSGGQYGGGSGGSVSGGGGDGVGGNAENAEARDTIGTGLAELAAGEGGGGSSTGGGGGRRRNQKRRLEWFVERVFIEADSGELCLLCAGIDALQLDYTVRFPLSLVISRKTILRYQLIFRYLLHLKHLEQSLRSHGPSTSNLPPGNHHPKLESWKRRIFNLRAKMLSFVQSLITSFASKSWRKITFRLANKVDTVDGLLREHRDFLDTCLKECMLTNSKLLKYFASSENIALLALAVRLTSVKALPVS